MAPTSSLNVTLGCAITVFVYYHYHGIKEQGIGPYLKHFAAPPGAPLFIAPIMFTDRVISHFSRVLSLSLRLFGNIFGEELVILILASIVPFLVPLPMMFLGLLTATLQAAIFVMLTMIYLGGAVHSEDHGDEHGHEHETVGAAPNPRCNSDLTTAGSVRRGKAAGWSRRCNVTDLTVLFCRRLSS